MVSLLAAALLAGSADPAQAAAPGFHGASSAQDSGRSLTIPAVGRARRGDALVAAIAFTGRAVATTPPGWRRIRSDGADTARKDRLTLVTYVRQAGAGPAGATWRFSRSVDAVGVLLAYGGTEDAALQPGSAGSLRRAGASSFSPPAVDAKRDAIVLGIFVSDEPVRLGGRQRSRGKARATRPGARVSLEVSARVAASAGRHAAGPASTAGAVALIGETIVLDPSVTAPGTSISGGPQALTNDTSASFSFTAAGPADGFQCSLDGAPARPCTSPARYTGLRDGAHTFRVAATAAGRSGQAATRSWTVDATGPPVVITSAFPVDGSISAESRGTFAFASPEPAAAFQCRLNTSPFVGCVSPISYGPFDVGTYVFQVRGVDSLGNVGPTATSTWIIGGGGGGGDGGAPAPVPVAPSASITSGPAALAASTSASFSFTASSAGATFACSLDSAAFAACTSPASLTGLAQGAHTFRVHAASGGLTGSDSSWAWTVDTVAPAPPAGLVSVPISPSNDNDPKLKGTAEAGSSVSVYDSGACSGSPLTSTLSAAAFASPGFAAHVPADTPTAFSARATDAAGNTSGCSSALIYVEDSTPPVPPGLVTDPVSPSDDNRPELTGVAEPGSTISIYRNGSCSGSPLKSGLSAAAFGAPGFSVTVFDNTTTTYSAAATDAAHNTSLCSATTYVESSAAGPALGSSLYPAVPDSPGPIFYVATNGSDGNSGSLNSPWRTIQHAVDTVLDGSIVEVRGGTYNEKLVIESSDGGTAAAPVTIRNYADETPILHPGPEPPGGFLAIPATTGGTLAASRYRYFVSATTPAGVTPTARQIVDTTGTTGSVALSWDSVSDATSYTVYRTVAGSTNAADAAVPTGQAKPIATLPAGTRTFRDTGAATPVGSDIADHYPLKIDGADYFRFQGFIIENASGISTTNVYITGLSDHVELSGNEIRNSQRQGIFVDAGTTNLHIERNWIHDNGGNARTRDHGVYIEGDSHQIASNVIADNRYGFGIQVFPAADNFIIASNTIVANAPTTNEAGIILGGDCSVGAACRADNNLVVNNILAGNTGPGIKVFWTGGNVGTNNRVENNVGFGNGGSGSFPTNSDGTGLVYGSGASANTTTLVSPFVDLALRNLTLAPGANAAVNTAAPAYAPFLDLLSGPRTGGAGPDIGALER